jgi:uroporphyrinogen decarboxylase
MNYNDSNVERLLKAFRQEKGDRVPYWESSIGKKMVEHILGREVPEGGLDARDHIELAQRIGMDAIGFGIYYSPGRVSKKDGAGKSHYIDGSIKTWEDVKRIEKEPPDFDASFARLTSYIKEAKGTNVGVWAYVHGPLDPVYLGMGLTDFSLMLYDDMKLVEYLMDHILEIQTQLVEMMAKLGVTFVHVGDDIGLKSGPIIRPELFNEIYPQRLEKLIKSARDRGVPVTYHSDGNIDVVIPILVDCGICALNPVEPYSNDIYEVKKKVGTKITLMGNIELTGRSPEQVAEDTRKHIEFLGDGAYVLASSHSITDDVPPENYEAMIEALHQYGKY